MNTDIELLKNLDKLHTTELGVLPFEIKRATANPYEALTEHEILDKLEKSREHTAQGMYKDATEVSRDMRAKYGL